MKYLTKEWYETMQKTDLHLLLRVSKKAESFSEEYFIKLYKEKEKAWLKLQEDVSKVRFEDMHPDEFHIHEAIAFDPEREKENFKQIFRYNVKHRKEYLPDEILHQVADIRVLAFDRVSADVKKEITAFCKANEKEVNAALRSYWKEYRDGFGDHAPFFTEDFNFHDCKVISCRKKGRNLVIELDNSGGYTNINQIILKKSTVLKQDGLLRGAWWLYDEIYKVDGGYEIHVLLQKDRLLDFIVRTTGVEYQYNTTLHES